MDGEGDNENDEYYVPVQTIPDRIIVKPNRFGQAASTSLNILTCKYNTDLKKSRPGSIETTKNELANVSIFKATMDHMNMIIHNFDDGYINLADPRILEAETS